MRNLLVIGVVAVFSCGVVACGSSRESDGAQGSLSSNASPSSATSADADCGGTNGNAAVAACHPGDATIQQACPDNSDGDSYAAPDAACLAAVRGPVKTTGDPAYADPCGDLTNQSPECYERDNDTYGDGASSGSSADDAP